MTESAPSLPRPDAVCDGGDLDCGSGLLLIIRNAMAPLRPGGVLEVRSREISVKEDLPAWCRMVGHELLGTTGAPNQYTHYAIRKQGGDERRDADLQQARDYAWQVRVKWTEGMRAKVFARNHSFEAGQPASFDTEDAAPAAVEYLLGALGSCLAVGLQWRLSQKQIEVFNLEVTLSARAENILVFLGIEDEGEPGFAAVEGAVYVDADTDADTLKALWEETLRRSPVASTLRRTIPLDISMRNA